MFPYVFKNEICRKIHRQAYIVCCVIIYQTIMKSSLRDEEIRWQVIKVMLDEFPILKEKTKEYIGQSRKQ